MSRYIRLSYDTSDKTPLYPKTCPVSIERVKEIDKGDSCNTYLITFSNHSGTHIDAPAHFQKAGKAISEYSPAELIFKKPFIVDCPKGPEEAIEVNDLETLNCAENYDCILIRTGFSKYRSSNTYIYSYKNPFLSPEAACWIRNNFPSLKAIGIDCISIASYSHKDSGRQAHLALLSEEGYKNPPILIMEDICIPKNLEKLRELMVSPFYIEGIDSAPCTIIGIVND